MSNTNIRSYLNIYLFNKLESVEKSQELENQLIRRMESIRLPKQVLRYRPMDRIVVGKQRKMEGYSVMREQTVA